MEEKYYLLLTKDYFQASKVPVRFVDSHFRPGIPLVYLSTYEAQEIAYLYAIDEATTVEISEEEAFELIRLSPFEYPVELVEKAALAVSANG